jgi:ATP-dependent exoDNAse (exonuclease V) beta subunit
MNDQSVVVANAGSGKTYLLANRIIRWMLQERRRTGHATPERVLAVTFTRKAAAEIVARVLRHLAQGASDPQKLSEFSAAEQVGEFAAADYQAVLEEFAQALHRISISTIDGFFSQLGRAFSPELGLPEHWEIGDEDELESQRIDAIGDRVHALVY